MQSGNYDVVIVWTTVHGGSWHKLIHFRQLLEQEGMQALLLVNCSEPMGLQKGVDFTPEQESELAAMNVRLLPFREIREAIRDIPARLYVFDAHEVAEVGEMIREVREIHGAKTAQISTLLADFACHDADYIFPQDRCTFYWSMDFQRPSWSKRFVLSKEIIYAGNMLFEPLENVWTSDVRDRESFCAKYGLDPDRKIGLWLPDCEDGLHESYAQVVKGLRNAGWNAVVKMHPWEYKEKRPEYLEKLYDGKTSAQLHDTPAIEEKDSSWAMRFADVGIIRGSSVSLELGVWKTPSVFIPSNPDPQFVKRAAIYQHMLEGCAFRIESAASLSDFLNSQLPNSIGDDVFNAASDKYLPREPDSFALHVEAFKRILGSSTPTKRLTKRQIRREYLGRIPFAFLHKRHYPEHLFHKALRALLKRV